MFSGLAVPQTIPIRRWTAVVAFTVQAATIVTLVGFPLIYPQNLPQAFSARQIFTPAVFQAVRTVQSQTGEHGTGFSQPRPLVVNTGHRFIFRNQDQDTSGLQGPSFGFVSGPPGVLDSILSINSQPVIISPRAATHATRRSVMMGRKPDSSRGAEISNPCQAGENSRNRDREGDHQPEWRHRADPGCERAWIARPCRARGHPAVAVSSLHLEWRTRGSGDAGDSQICSQLRSDSAVVARR